ncbi:MAG: hypothetical protein ABL962_06980 [Fimbriimonadaceae bacterium]
MKALSEMSREELYDLVWSEAMITVAPRFGISDVALKKRCKVRGVPTPPRGYWAKVEAGKSPGKTNLPKEIPPPVSKPTMPRFADEMIYFAVDGADYTLTRPDPITTATRKVHSRRAAFRQASYESSDGRARISVSPKSLGRALWLLDSLIKEARRLGMTVEANGGSESGLKFLAFGESGEVEIREKVRRFNRREYVPKKVVRWPDSNEPYEFCFCGFLKIKVKMSYYSDEEWVDSIKRPLDNAIEETAATILQSLKACADRREDRRQAEIRRQEEARRAEERRRAAEQERAKRQELEHLAKSLTLSAQILNLADGVEISVRNSGIDPYSDERVSTWLQWAREHADRLDPIKSVTRELSKDRN